MDSMDFDTDLRFIAGGLATARTAIAGYGSSLWSTLSNDRTQEKNDEIGLYQRHIPGYVDGLRNASSTGRGGARTTPPHGYFSVVPTELLFGILHRLSIQAVQKIKRTCSLFGAIIAENQEIWRSSIGRSIEVYNRGWFSAYLPYIEWSANVIGWARIAQIFQLELDGTLKASLWRIILSHVDANPRNLESEHDELYQGPYRNGRYGKARSTHFSGDKAYFTYDGRFSRDVYNGNATITTRKFVAKCKFRKGKIEGDVHFVYSQGPVLECTCSCTRPMSDALEANGTGQILYRDGSCYTGGFDDLLREGSGVMVYADGSVYEGSWEDDFRIGRGGDEILKRISVRWHMEGREAW